MNEYVSPKEATKNVCNLLNQQKEILLHQYKELSQKHKNLSYNLTSYPLNEEDRWHTLNAYTTNLNRLNLVCEALEKLNEVRSTMLLFAQDSIGYKQIEEQ